MSSSAITGPVLSDTRRAPAGTAAAPSFAFNDSTGTGVYLVSPGVLGLSTAGVQRVVVDASGNVGIGTASPSLFTGYTTVSVNNATNGGIYNILVNGTETARLQAFSGIFNVAAKGASTNLTFETNGAERMRLYSDGSVSIIRNNSTAKKFCIIANKDESDTTTNLVTLAPVSVNCRSFIKVTVKIVSAVANIANEHVGYALINASTGIAPAGMTVVSGSSIGGFTSVGSLSWSGTTLRYTTSTAANLYLTCSIDVELVARDGHVISFP